MYAVVGCGECEGLWIVETGAESSQCPRCGTTRPLAKRTKFATADDEDRARDLRTRLLAERRDVDAESVAGFSELADAVDDAGPSDETYLAGAGLDPESVAAAGESATGGESGDRRSIVEGAIDAVEEPTAAAIVAYATDRGVPEDAAHSLLAELERRGAVTARDGVYRRL